VKFTDALEARAQPNGDVQSRNGAALGEVSNVASRYGMKFRPQIALSEDEMISLEQRAAARSGKAQPDLAGMMIVDMPATDRESLIRAAQEMRDLPEIEYVYLEPLDVPPPVDIPPMTPDLVAEQDYRGPDPGMDVDYAVTQSGTGTGIRYSDCEYGWNPDHEDFNDLDLHLEAGQTIHPDTYDNGWDSHGTAVVGETSAAVNAYGCSGMAPDAPIFTYPEKSVEDGNRRVACITNAINDSGAGDMVLLEMQTGGVAEGSLVPAEYNINVWNITKVGTDAGVIVVGAAGNGNVDLDSDDYQDYMDRGDSGAIIVGGGTANTSHNKTSGSTYGSRVNLQGWGTGVFTLGYGGFAEYGGDKNQRYTSTFNGTSSASPFVASAAMVVQDVWEAFSGSRMTPLEMRDHLIATGIPQGTGGHIGPLPNLRDAINELPGYNEPPVAVCQDLVISADDDCQAFATADDVDDGSYDPDGDTFTKEISPVGPYPLGDTAVTLTVTDEHGTSDSCTATISVVDTTPPVVVCPTDVIVECVAADGVPADDAQLAGFFAGFAVSDNCDDDPAVMNDAPAFFEGPCGPGGGVTVVTWTATDFSGNESQCSANVTVVDTTAPEIVVSVAPQVLWPPNHKMVEVNYTVIVSDICDDDPMWVLVDVVSNEPQDDNGDGSTEPDIQDADLGTPDSSVSLRAERDGRKTGRIYTATFEVTDCSGNTSMAESNVYVPHSQSDMVNILASSGSGANGSGKVSYMVPGASIWGDDTPVEIVDGGGARQELRFIDPLSAIITNTAGFVVPTAFYVKDVDFDNRKDVLVEFELSALEDLNAVSDELDGVPVMALEIGQERFMIIEMVEIQETDLDLDGAIAELRFSGDAEDILVQGKAEAAVLRPAGLIGAAPNPFNPSTKISYYIPDTRHVELAIFDISGRRISRLVSQTMAAGEHSVMWHGTDTRGSRVASGVYFYQITAGTLVETKRMILVK